MAEKKYHVDDVYLDLLENIYENGVERKDRTGVGTKGIFGAQQRYDLTKGFPLLTTKKVYTRAVIGELLFFLTGRTDNQWLTDRNIHIWDEWAGVDGDLGPIYGFQWRYFGAPYVSQTDRDNGVNPGGVDQITNLLEGLKNNPYSRRHIVSAWNPMELDNMALPPCHTMFQFYVTPDAQGNPYGLSCQLYQRSGDTFLGIPFNIASYSILTHMIADYLGLKPLEFIHTVGDAHIYSNHYEQVEEQLSRREDKKPMCKLTINHPFEIEGMDFSDKTLFNKYKIEDFVFENYESLPAIKAPIAV